VRPRPVLSTVLLLDDDPVFSGVLACVLEDEGYTVLRRTAAEAVVAELNAGLRPALIIVDHLLRGGMTGTAFAFSCAGQVDLAGIPLVMVSGLTPDPEVATSAPVNVRAFLRKPFHADDILRVVNSLSPAGV
jgi:CheY-like chemotaxis protein